MNPDTQPRHRANSPGVESWFLRAVHPTLPRGIWLKSTVLVPRNGAPVAELWCAVFDGDATWADKATVPLAEATFGEEGIRIAGSLLRMKEGAGEARGQLGEACDWNLRWRALPGKLGEPLCLIPRRLIDAPFPKNKLLSPAPVITLNGTLRLHDHTFDLDGWIGSLGHNWGARHSPEYAWGQVVFTNKEGEPTVFAEGFSGRIQLGPVRSPLLSALTVRRGDERYVFDRLVDVWRHRVSFGDLSWTLRMRGHAGEAVLALTADAERMVCLGYGNPDGSLAYCLNSKLARAVLRVQPVNADAFEVTTDHGAALELLSMTADPRFPNPV